MSIRVEFYGIPRQRAGVEAATVAASRDVVRLGDVLSDLTIQFPSLAPECIANGQLRQGCTADFLVFTGR